MPKAKTKDKKIDKKDQSDEEVLMSKALEDDKFIPQRIQKGRIVEGKILEIEKEYMLVDLGSKAEGVILGSEMKDEKEYISSLKEGDSILVFVLKTESDHGQPILSLKRAGIERKWRILKKAYENNEKVKVKVLEHNKGGLVVDAVIKGFVPLSQLSPERLKPISDKEDMREFLDELIGKKLEVRVIELNRRTNRLIFSEKSVSGAKTGIDKDIFKKIVVGKKIKGAVSRIVPFGILVDLGGIEGLVHISEVSWDRLKKPADLYNIGDEIEVLVLEKDEANRKTLLSLKRLLPDPWGKAREAFNIGDEVEGKITKIVPFGIFARVGEGIDGLIHSSQIIEKKVEFKVGDEVKLRIITFDPELKRMSLSPID